MFDLEKSLEVVVLLCLLTQVTTTAGKLFSCGEFLVYFEYHNPIQTRDEWSRCLMFMDNLEIT